MEKTMEEILTPYAYTEQWGFIDVVSLANAKKAMQEYADQEKEKDAIEFVKWMSYLMESNYMGKENWYCKDGKIRTIKELYQIFKKEQHGK